MAVDILKNWAGVELRSHPLFVEYQRISAKFADYLRKVPENTTLSSNKTDDLAREAGKKPIAWNADELYKKHKNL